MKFNGILTLVVSVLVVVLISAAAIVPIVQQAQEEQTTMMNNPDARYAMASSTEKVAITIDIPSGKYYVNGIEQEQSSLPVNEMQIYGSTFSCRANNSGEYQQYIDSTSTASASLLNGIVSIVYENGTATLTNASNVSREYETSFLIYPSDKGNLGIYRTTDLPNLHIDNKATFYIASINSSSSYLLAGQDKVLASATEFNTPGWEEATWDVDFTEDETGLSYTIAINSLGVILTDESTVNIQNGRVYAPVTYTGISENDSMMIALLGIIPMLIFIIPIMLIVRSFGVGRD